MTVHLEFIADDLGTVAALLAPLSSSDVVLEFLNGGEVYISIDLRDEPTPEPRLEDRPGNLGVGADEPEVAGDDVAAQDVIDEALADPDPDPGEVAVEPEPGSDRVEQSEPESDEPPIVIPEGDASCPEAIVALLEANPDVAFPGVKVADCLPRFKEGTVKMVLAKLARERRIQRVRAGVYEAN